MSAIELGMYFLIGIFVLGLVMGIVMAIFKKEDK